MRAVKWIVFVALVGVLWAGIHYVDVRSTRDVAAGLNIHDNTVDASDPGIPIHDIAMHLGKQTGGHVVITFFADESDTSVIVFEQDAGIPYSSHRFSAEGHGHTLQEALQSLHSEDDDDDPEDK